MRDDDRRARRRFGPPGGHGYGPGFGPGLGRGGRRAARGDVRAAILALLALEPMHGYQIINELTDRTGGLWRPSPGSVYPTLQHLEEAGLVSVEDRDGKRTFALTDAGRAEAESRDPGRPAPWEEVGRDTTDSVVDLRDAMLQVITAAKQVLHAGDAEHIKAAREVLVEARRGLYRILAED